MFFALAGIIAAVLAWIRFTTPYFSPTDLRILHNFTLVTFVSGLVAAVSILLVFLESLIPYETDLYGQTRGSDGLQILRLFWPHVPKVTRKNAALTDFDRRMAALTIRRSFKTSPCSSPLAATSGTA